MVTEISSEQIVLDLARRIVYAVRPLARECEKFNELPNIPWPRREQMRTIEGKLDGIDQALLEFLDSRFGNSDAVDKFILEIWGE